MTVTPTLVDARLGPGTLKLGGTEFGAQISNVTLTPDVSTDDGTPTLAIPEPEPLSTIKWSLDGSAVQDFTEATGFVNYCADHALETVAFEWTPNTPDGTKWTGNCQVLPVEIGGDVAVQITTDFSFPVVGEPARVDGPGTLEASSAKASK